MIGKIATGEVGTRAMDNHKEQAAKAFSKKGGAARGATMTLERRSEIAETAAVKGWTN